MFGCLKGKFSNILNHQTLGKTYIFHECSGGHSHTCSLHTSVWPKDQKSNNGNGETMEKVSNTIQSNRWDSEGQSLGFELFLKTV